MNGNILKIGHRGAMGHVAENTLESIKRALEFEVDGIEVDVHRCASGELVVFHDFTLDRMTNGSGEISKFDLAELKKIKVNDTYSIPTLKEVLELIGSEIFINIELKGRNTAKEIVNVIREYLNIEGWSYDNFLVSSFQHTELEKVYQLDKNINLAILTKANVYEALDFAKTINARTIHPNIAIVTHDNIKYLKSLGYKVNVWTANSDAVISRMKSYGVDGIISDFPDKL